MIPTGIEKLDAFLSGGIPPGVIVDVFGANGTGKTQFLLQLCMTCIRGGGRVLYVDATGNFRPERIIELQKRHGLEQDCLEQIKVFRVTDTGQQTGSLEEIRNGAYSLVLIDNVTDLFSYEYTEAVLEKNSVFMRYLGSLSQTAAEKGVPVVMTNMIRDADGTETENMRAAVRPFVHVRIHLSRGVPNHSGTVSWALGRQTFYYEIGESGLTDAQDI